MLSTNIDELIWNRRVKGQGYCRHPKKYEPKMEKDKKVCAENGSKG